jgi:hypothetical protein
MWPSNMTVSRGLVGAFNTGRTATVHAVPTARGGLL